jgi:hypothetical protein
MPDRHGLQHGKPGRLLPEGRLAVDVACIEYSHPCWIAQQTREGYGAFDTQLDSKFPIPGQFGSVSDKQETKIRMRAHDHSSSAKHGLHALHLYHPANLGYNKVLVRDAISLPEFSPSAKVHFTNLDSVCHNNVAG